MIQKIKNTRDQVQERINVVRFRRILMLLVDAFSINLGVYIVLLMRFDGSIPELYTQAFWHLSPAITVIFLAALIFMRLYDRVWEYASICELISILKATTIGMTAFIILVFLFNFDGLPRSVYIGSWAAINIFIGASRVWWRVYRTSFSIKDIKGMHRVLVIGAGNAASILIKEIQSNPRMNINVVGIVDDDRKKIGLRLHDVPILGGRCIIPQLVEEMKVDEVIIAIPSAPGAVIRDIVNICKGTTARIKILPGVYESAEQSFMNKVRDIQMEDLLKRVPAKINLEEIAGYISGRVVLVTGAGGSIGSELCRQIIRFSPEKLVLLDNNENNLFEIEIELKSYKTQVLIWTELVDVRNNQRLEEVFRLHQPNVVFHAAAFKHVPMMERHPDHALNNNVIGTRNTALLSDKYGAETFILISTDKAVNPTSIMGASKRIAELVIMDINRRSRTRFASVRFGNVLGSRGSVIPTFMKQIERGGPVTVTHPDIRRYFMTIPEAVELVIEAGALANGGETFVLDMGEMIKINDLANELIRLSGFEPGRDIKIVYTGLRPGEKLYEECFTNREEMATTRHERIFISCKELDNRYNDISKGMETLIRGEIINKGDVLRTITELVPEFQGKQKSYWDLNATFKSAPMEEKKSYRQKKVLELVK